MSPVLATYIVMFKRHATPEQIKKYQDDITECGGEIGHDLGNGFSAKIPDSHFQSLQQDDLIDYIEADQEVRIQ